MDIAIKETGNGLDIIKTSKDLLVIFGFQNMPYLALFGGNVASSTPIKRLASEEAFDWWGNSLLMGNEPAIQFNSLTERALRETPLTSSGRVQIQQAIKSDLAFMKPFARVGIAVAIVATDKLILGIRIIQPDNLEQREFIFMWDAARGELLDPYDDGSTPDPVRSGFDYTLDFEFE